jgi:hypothetical protein
MTSTARSLSAEGFAAPAGIFCRNASAEFRSKVISVDVSLCFPPAHDIQRNHGKGSSL